MPIPPSLGQWIPMRDRYQSMVWDCVCDWQKRTEGELPSHFHAFLQKWTCSFVHFFSYSFSDLPRSYVSMTSGSLLFPVHRSLIKPSNEGVMHNFICSSGTWGHFLTSLKSMIVSFWKAITLLQWQALGSQMLNGPFIDSCGRRILCGVVSDLLLRLFDSTWFNLLLVIYLMKGQPFKWFF